MCVKIRAATVSVRSALVDRNPQKFVDIYRVRPGYYAEQHLPNPLAQPSPTASLR